MRGRPDDAARRFASELGAAATAVGATQRLIGRRAGVAQSEVSRILRGTRTTDLRTAEALARAVGHRLVVSLLPAEGLRLRDSGQVQLADAIRREAHRVFRVALEVPVGRPPDLRAADMVLEGPIEIIHVEIERWLRDFQAQLRRAQLKRMALAERRERPVRLVLALPDSTSNRRIVNDHRDFIAATFGVGARRAWAAIRSGEELGGDALIWVRSSRQSGHIDRALPLR